MTEGHEHHDESGQDAPPEALAREAGSPARGKRKRSLSMHDGIAVWCDCCSCEAEPYWVEIAEEMGMDLGSDYEDEDTGGP
jgi:hypothetical protein